MDERLTRHFYRREFACGCGCGLDFVDYALVDSLQRLRDLVGEAVVVNSGVRCAKHNAAVGGQPDSQHLLGKAADISVAGYRPAVLAGIAEQVGRFGAGGIGIYETFLHVDVRGGGPARWNG